MDSWQDKVNMRRGGWKVKNWEIEGGGGPWSIEGGDLGSGGLSGGCDGFTTPFTATNPTLSV